MPASPAQIQDMSLSQALLCGCIIWTMWVAHQSVHLMWTFSLKIKSDRKTRIGSERSFV